MSSNPLADCYLAAQERLASSLHAAQEASRKACSVIERTTQLLRAYDAFFAEALEHRQLFPYAAFAEPMVTGLSAQFADLDSSPYIMDSLLSGAFSRLQHHTRRFHRLHRLAERHIQLEAIPTPALDGRKVFLPSTKVIVPAQIPGDIGYHAYALFYSVPRQEPLPDEAAPEGQPQTIEEEMEKMSRLVSSPVDIEQLTQTPCFTVEDALDRYTCSSELCTVAFAQNAELFPLAETALPIVVEKYRKAVASPAEKGLV